MHNCMIPRLLTNQLESVRKMKVEARAGISFYRYVEVEACLIGEGFEEGGNTAGAFLVEIGYGVGAVIARGRAVAEGEAVANKQDAFGRLSE